MEHYSLRQNPKPFKKQTVLSHKILYKLDRRYVLEKEKYDKRDMIAYDRRIKNEKLKTLTQQGYLIQQITEVLKNKKERIEFGFNEYNGYFLICGKYQFETFNYLKLDILKQLLSL